MTINSYKSPFGVIRYIEYNQNEANCPILFIHGLGCRGSTDYPEIAKSITQHPSIIVDLLGSGLSDRPKDFTYSLINHAELLQELILSLNINELIIYGHSMGGTIAILLAELLQTSNVIVQNLILSEANLESGGGEFSKSIADSSLEKFQQLHFQQIVNTNLETDNSSNKKWATSLSDTLPKAVYEEAVALVVGQKKSWREIFYKLSCQKTFIFGEYSLPDDDMEILEGQGINIEIVSMAGHSMAWENPDDLALAMKRAINNGD